MLHRLSRTLVITGTLLIWLIKWIIRPMEVGDEFTRYLMNVSPNLFGSFLIPFAAYWMFTGRDHLMARVFRISNPFELRIVCILGFLMLVLNEYLQQIPLFGRTFDYNDILFSSVGLIGSCIVFGKLQARQLSAAVI